ncbi:hypothetical protein B9Z48_06400 [Limnohabitans sp. WS1]|nr:hypothetical protein B9Z48_06400 [Limnohabitans sp. WS1]
MEVVCEAFRDGGVAPTGGLLHFVGAPPSGRWRWSARLFATGASLLQGASCILWEPRPRGDYWWFARVIATGASLLQGGTCIL